MSIKHIIEPSRFLTSNGLTTLNMSDRGHLATHLYQYKHKEGWFCQFCDYKLARVSDGERPAWAIKIPDDATIIKCRNVCCNNEVWFHKTGKSVHQIVELYLLDWILGDYRDVIVNALLEFIDNIGVDIHEGCYDY